MVYSYLNGMQEPTSIIVPLLLRSFLSTNMSQPLFTTAVQPGKGDSILQKRDLLTFVFTQNPN